MVRELKSVRVDAELVAELERLAREGVIVKTFAAQVNAGLRLLVRRATDSQDRRAAQLLRVDSDRAMDAYRRLRQDDR